jgi:glyoxylase-like metal-dependent hydrolase (beta-lactamase superfamily II)
MAPWVDFRADFHNADSIRWLAEERGMYFEQIANGPCLSYVIACEKTRNAVVVDPAIDLVDRYRTSAAQHGLHIRYVLDTHTHADHFSGARELARQTGAAVVMHCSSAAPFVDLRVDDGESLLVGELRILVRHTPGHTSDAICLVLDDRVLTGDTLLIGGTGRTDLPSGDPSQLYDSLFGRLLALDPALAVYPAHDYHGRSSSTLGEEAASNPRLRQREREAFVAQMKALDLDMPRHLTEALRTNRSGGKPVSQLIGEAAIRVPFMSLEEVRDRLASRATDLLLLDVREKEAYQAGHIPGAVHLPRGQLELRVNDMLTDPTRRIVCYCEFGKISTLATATLRELGFMRAVALHGGYDAWKKAGYPQETA